MQLSAAVPKPVIHFADAPALAVPRSVVRDLSDGITDAITRVRDFALTHPAADTTAYRAFVSRDVVGTPPRDAVATSREVTRVARANAGRDDAVDAALHFYDKYGTKAIWDDAVRELGAAKGAGVADAARSLIKQTLDGVSKVSGAAKREYLRPRPFASRASIEPLYVRSFDRDHSFPSGHSAKAFFYSTLIAGFWPERARELREVANRVAYSRIVAGFHHVSDIVAGARLGAAMATSALDARTR